MQIIRQSRIVEAVEYRRDFQIIGEPEGNGYSYEVTADGRLRKPAQAEHVEGCLAEVAAGRLLDRGVRARRWSYREPAVGRCSCGRHVVLDGFTCPCECGRDYNWAGQQLAPRSQWGEETGESLGEILSIP